ncbi:MAG: hypothetical protein RR668_04960 [Algoriella sp.]|uniref:hypothetical protein n=1 Tax=Algoriella sp. TaxID=1872434 RepID=UPI002FCC8A5A
MLSNPAILEAVIPDLQVKILFWLSLLPISPGWMSENFQSPLPVTLYGFMIIQKVTIKKEGKLLNFFNS